MMIEVSPDERLAGAGEASAARNNAGLVLRAEVLWCRRLACEP
jgi:hypothetical protein